MITSRQNDRLKAIRRLRRRRGDEAVLEGPHLLREALDAELELETVLVTPDWLETDEGKELAARLSRPPLEVAPPLLNGLTDADSPRGVVALASLPRRGADALLVVEGGVYLYADGVQDPGNVGALARSAEAAGAVGLALAPGSAHPNHPRALRASAGSLLRLPVAVGVDPDTLGRHLGDVDPVWLTLVPRGGQSLDDPLPRRSVVVAVGSEGPGLGDEIRRLGIEVTVPMAGRVESLNTAVAASLVLFELQRRRAEDGGREHT